MYVVKLDIKRYVFESTSIKTRLCSTFFGSDFLAYADPAIQNPDYTSLPQYISIGWYSIQFAQPLL